jgi:hypothetical protein
MIPLNSDLLAERYSPLPKADAHPKQARPMNGRLHLEGVGVCEQMDEWMYRCTSVFVCVFVCLHVHVHVCVCVCACVCLSVCLSIVLCLVRLCQWVTVCSFARVWS